MSERLQKFLTKVGLGRSQWGTRVGRPYVGAYNIAFDAYGKTIQSQKDADKERAELLVTAASVVSGSLLMAVAGSASLRVLAGNAALKAVCARELNRTFEVMHTVYNSRTAMFALGKAMDEAKDRAGKLVKDAVTQMLTANNSVLSVLPLNQLINVETMLDNLRDCAIIAASNVDGDRQLSEAQKNILFAQFNAAPIANIPHGSTNVAQLAPRLELSFYLKLILDSDELDTVISPGGTFGMTPVPMRARSQPIPQLPGAPDYPKPRGGNGAGSQWIGVNRPGDKIRSQVDKLHQQIYHKPFYRPGGFLMFGDVSGPEKMAELKRAADLMSSLASETRPLAPLHVRL